MEFNGTSDWVDAGMVASEMGIGGANDKSIMAWTFCRDFTAADANTPGCVWSLGTAGTTNQDFTLRPLEASRGGGTDNWRVNHWAAADYDFVTATTSLNVWWHFVVTYNDADNFSRVYGNGVQIDTDFNSSINTADNIPLRFGKFDGDTETTTQFNFYDGFIADARVYSRTLNAAEIMTIYRARGKDNVVESLEGRWLMNDGVVGDTVPATFAGSTTGPTNLTNDTEITIAVPSACSDGDLMVAIICPSGNATGTPADVDTITGWDFVASVDCPSTVSTPSMFVFERTASSEPANYTFTLTSQTCSILGHMYCYRNMNTFASGDVATSTGSGNDDPLCPTVTVSGGGSWLTMRIICADGEVLATNADDIWATRSINYRRRSEVGGVTSNGVSMAVADQNRTPATAVGTELGDLTAAQEWATMTLLFKPTGFVHDESGTAGHPHNALATSFEDESAGTGPVRVVGVLRR